MEQSVAIVCGRRIEEVVAAELEELINQYDTVVVDLGTGDGLWLYRLARSRPAVLCLGIDAHAGALRDVSYRASRKPARGGLPNIRFIAAAVESLPGAMRAAADEVWLVYPWGSLLRAMLAPDPAILRRVAGVLKPRGVIRVAINESVLTQAAVLRRTGLMPRPAQDLYAAMCAGYNEAGLTVTTWRFGGAWIRSSWAGRLGQGAALRTLWVEAVNDGDRRDHGG